MWAYLSGNEITESVRNSKSMSSTIKRIFYVNNGVALHPQEIFDVLEHENINSHTKWLGGGAMSHEINS